MRRCCRRGRPAINLKMGALDEIMGRGGATSPREERVAGGLQGAPPTSPDEGRSDEREAIGRHGLKLIEEIAAKEKKPGEPGQCG